MALTFTELGNVDMAKRLVKMSYNVFKEEICENVKDSPGEYKKMIKTCKQIIEGNGKVERKFEWKNGKQFGRKYTVDGGIQGLKKVVRGVLSEGLTTDVDIKMCYQMILLKICQDRNIKCGKLIHYIKNREAVLEDMYSTDGLNREDAKDTFHICINKKQLVKNVSNQFFKSFDIEMKRIMNTLWEMSDLEWMKEYADTSKGNVKGSFMSNLLQKYEDEIITACIPVLRENNLEICTLCFDGFLLKGDMYECKNVLDKLKEVTDSLGYEIEWVFKSHKFKVFENFNEKEDNENWTEEDYALQFIDKFGDDFILGGDKNYIINEYGIYHELKHIKKTISQYLLKEFSYTFLKKASHLNAVSTLIDYHLFKDSIEDEFDKQECLIPFDNGVYDLKVNEFRCANRTEYISKTVKYSFEFIDYSDLELILRNLVYPDCGDYFLWKLGNILRGDNKIFTAMIGGGNNGKTKVVAKCIQDTFGDFYNAVDIGLVKAGDKNDNTNNATPQLMKFKDSMFNLVSELPQGVKLSCNRIKALTGGSTFQGRNLFSNKVENFKCKGQLWADTNDLGEFDVVDQPLIDRLEVIPFPYKFTTEDEIKKDPENKFLKPIIVDILNTVDNYKVKFMHLMIKNYYKCKPEIPESTKSAKMKVLHDIDDIAKFLDDMCSVQQGMRCTATHLYDAYKSTGGDKTRKVFIKGLETRGFEYKVRKVQGITQRGFEGIGLKTDIGGEEDPE